MHDAWLPQVLAAHAPATPEPVVLLAAAAEAYAADHALAKNAEEERLAAALLSVVRRKDFDATSLEPWLARFVQLEQQVWTSAAPDAARLDAALNARRLLQSLFVLLSMPGPEPAPAQAATQQKVLATLQSTRR